jgi:hypothetical protein
LALVSNSFSSASDVGIMVISKSSSSGVGFRLLEGFNGVDGGSELLPGKGWSPSLLAPSNSATIFRFLGFFGLGVVNSGPSLRASLRSSSSLDNFRM